MISIIKYILLVFLGASALGQVILLALLACFVALLGVLFRSIYIYSKKSPEQIHIERIKYLIELFTNIKLEDKNIVFMDYQINYGWPVETTYKFQILVPINELILLDFDTYKKDHPRNSYDVLISKLDTNQTYAITCLDYDDKQFMF